MPHGLRGHSPHSGASVFQYVSTRSLAWGFAPGLRRMYTCVTPRWTCLYDFVGGYVWCVVGGIPCCLYCNITLPCICNLSISRSKSVLVLQSINKKMLPSTSILEGPPAYTHHGPNLRIWLKLLLMEAGTKTRTKEATQFVHFGNLLNQNYAAIKKSIGVKLLHAWTH